MSSLSKITGKSKRKTQMKTIAVKDLHIDPTVQREIVPTRVNDLATEMDLDGLGVVVVSDRGNKRYFVLDGQHRIAALMQLGFGDWEVNCLVYSGLKIEQEAAIFRRLNNTRKITPFDDFTKGLVEKDPECLHINQIVTRHGFSVSKGGGDGSLTCVSRARKVYKRDGGKTLDQTLATVSAAWGDAYPGVEKDILGGLALLHEKYGGQLDRGSLVKKLSKFQGGPSGLLGTAKAARAVKAGSIEKLVFDVVLTEYNKGKRSGRLTNL